MMAAGFWLLAGLCLPPTIAVFATQVQVVLLSCSLQLLGLIVGILFVPETLPPSVAAEEEEDHRRQQFSEEAHRWKESKCQYLVFMATRPICELSIINRNSFFLLLLSAAFLAFFSGM
jgi:hypothetical protein